MPEQTERAARRFSTRQPTTQRPARAAEPTPTVVGGPTGEGRPMLRLLSAPAGAMRAMWQEQTRMILTMLAPHEQWVLHLRYGVGKPSAAAGGDSPWGPAMPPREIREIEIAALRKLRHPCAPRQVRSTTRG